MTATLADRRQALLQAILESPEDDTPRLVLADVLDDLGESERAEFIRVQIELAQRFGVPAGGPVVTGDRDEDAREQTLRRRERQIFDKHFRWWIPPIGKRWLPIDRKVTDAYLSFDAGDHKTARLSFRRGFVDEVTLSARDWLAHGDALLAAQPVQVVRLTTVPTLTIEDHEYGRFKYSLDGSDFAIFGDMWMMECDDLVLRLLRTRWPRVRDWVLPS